MFAIMRPRVGRLQVKQDGRKNQNSDIREKTKRGEYLGIWLYRRYRIIFI